jgi:putative two-component system response regulator
MTLAMPYGAEQRSLLTFAPLSSLDSARELVDAIQRLSLARSVEDVQVIVRTAARRLTGADGATFVLRDGSDCCYVDEDAISPLWKGQRFPMRACISGWAMMNREPAVIEDIYLDERIPHDAYRPTFVKSLAMVPIRTLAPIGAIGNYWAARHRPSAEEVEVLQALADSTAVAMENVRVYQELDDARLETLQRLALAAEYRDDATHEHGRRVARTTALLAERLGLAPSEVTLLAQAAPLHDIGKLAVSDTVLLKPGRLTRAERAQIRGHAAAGAALLAGSTSVVLRLAHEIALTHHEWWDGGGYPSGLRGEAIPLSGRIVALADVFDALTHERPYKPAWPAEEAAAELQRLAGRQFDPRVVEAFAGLDAAELASPLAGAVGGAKL